MAQIKKDTSLRKAILQAAITGQLVSTTENTEQTGKELLDTIIEERNKKALADWQELLKTNPKAKKPAPIVASAIAEEETPFEIPETWCWCRLGEIIDIRDGTHDSPKYVTSGIPLITSKNISNGYIDFSKVDYLSDADAKKINARSYVNDGDILFAMIGSIGNPVIVKKDKEFCIKNVALFKNEFKNYLNNKFLFYFFVFIQDRLKKIAAGGVQSFIALSVFRKLSFPLPPLAVQNAIVAKLGQVLPLVDAYENAVAQKEELKVLIKDKIKKAILQEAVTGKITQSWRQVTKITQTGKELLDNIIEERNKKALADWKETLKTNPKAKKPSPIVASKITEEEIPFEIPETWCWCRLGEICKEIKRGKSPKYTVKSDYLAFAQKCNVKTGGIDLGLALYLDDKTIGRYSKDDNLIQGDVVINSTGGGTMGRVGYYETKVPEGIKGVYPDSHVTVIRSIGNINQRFLYYVLKHNQPSLEDCGTGSTNQTELKPAVLSNLVVPLPPLAEQQAIVQKLEELLPLCQ